MKDALTGTYKSFRNYEKELKTVIAPVNAILEKDRFRRRSREKAQDINTLRYTIIFILLIRLLTLPHYFEKYCY